ncbi:DUF1648 domain-containing protein [Streptomyces marincola]|uniref:DUF1648 domain-containing protein n=1 Tax=Streptomyces marincola TaxID=2878388 RepID=UPI001CF107EF|nr:DUF1648 domain-containing protein [Streptomyces marincola]UCM91432.1 DUF1648 domain-containing protein [Streptomyces marincola]
MRRGPKADGRSGERSRPAGAEAERRLPWGWLAPSVLLLCGMAVWGVLRYQDLPDRVPQHIGPGGVDAWADKTVLSAFIPVWVYAGLTLALAGCVALTARTTPRDELPESADRWSAAMAAMSNRPASRASARRLAKALLQTNAVLGVALLPLAWLQWRGVEATDVPGWVLPVTLGLILLSTAPVAVARWHDHGERKRSAAGPEQRTGARRTAGG